ncbi:hypothetical protein [Nocardioides sp. SLBN-35]|uniref:hypothetical protein n=1 Tax=Nocardioides sp. SLBN-35 TaxID=2768445 RepID=UPI00114EC0C8|nr:hypothetical protein [Nocardioides sp. SLBN-35]TQK72211.1 hypothetical protein FBY23_4021 [Nocardioides sp. SLBN-35]
MTLHRALRTVVAALLAAATVVLLPQTPASAAACDSSTGVTVVVDSNELGAGISAGCDANGGGTAANNFADAGYTIEYSQAAGMNGFVCKVNGKPSDGDCTQTDAYWSLWWSDGRTGTWTYASIGVGGLKVPDGGYVAFAWHQGSGRAAPPDVAPTPRVQEAKPTPTTSPTKAATPKPTKKATPKPSATPSASTTSATPTASATPSATDTTSATATPTEATTSAAPPEPSQTTTTGLPSIDEITDGPEATSADTDSKDGGGFPAWLGIGLVVVVLGAAGAVPLVRRLKA